MKTILITLLFFATTAMLLAQQTQFVSGNSNLRISAVKDGELSEWENQNIAVSFDFRTGEFITRFKNIDFMQPNVASIPSSKTIEDTWEYLLEGIFPIFDIKNQHQEQQDYKVELQLTNIELNLSQTILFDMTILKPESGDSQKYFIFNLNGVIYNDRFNLPALEEFEDEIQIRLTFNGHINIR